VTGETPTPLDTLMDYVTESRFQTKAAALDALAQVEALAEAPTEALRRLLDAYYGENPESVEVAVAAQKVEAWLAALVPFAAREPKA